jgi:hypothetical protein
VQNVSFVQHFGFRQQQLELGRNSARPTWCFTNEFSSLYHFHHTLWHDCLSCFYCAYGSYKELCDEVGVQTPHSAFVVEILMYWRSRLQMVEQFEDRVEDRLVEMEEKLQAVSEKATQMARTLESERTTIMNNQVSTKAYAPPSRN